MIDKLCIIGVGLIGGSLARALREQGSVGRITGCSRNAQHLQRAQDLGVIDDYSTDLADAVKDANMIVVCVPLGAMQTIFTKLADALPADAIITDVGSAKAGVIEAARQTLGDRIKQFVPGHPIAGTEKSGVEASFATLFQSRRIIITPIAENSLESIQTVRQMWEQTGAVVQEMSPEHHDEVLAATSHLPHVLAFGLVDTLSMMRDRDEMFQYAAGGFRDFTRIASSDPVMWRDICLHNRDAILAMMDRYMQDLQKLNQAIADSDAEQIKTILERAKAARDRYTKLLETAADDRNG